MPPSTEAQRALVSQKPRQTGSAATSPPGPRRRTRARSKGEASRKGQTLGSPRAWAQGGPPREVFPRAGRAPSWSPGVLRRWRSSPPPRVRPTPGRRPSPPGVGRPPGGGVLPCPKLPLSSPARLWARGNFPAFGTPQTPRPKAPLTPGSPGGPGPTPRLPRGKGPRPYPPFCP
jgi:hypothetical protein